MRVFKVPSYVMHDAEMLFMGAVKGQNSPPRFMTANQYELSVVKNDPSHNPIPMVLPVPAFLSDPPLTPGDTIVIADRSNTFPHEFIVRVNGTYTPSELEVTSTLGPRVDSNHPWYQRIVNRTQGADACIYVDATILTRSSTNGTIRLDTHQWTNWLDHRLSPSEVKWSQDDQQSVLGFQTRNPLHGCHLELIEYALNKVGTKNLALMPIIGETQPGDIDPWTRVRCYQHAVTYLRSKGYTVTLILLPLAMRMAGPREALWHAQIRAAYGCTHFVVGRDHAGPSTRSANDGNPFYTPYEAQELATRYAPTVFGIQIVTCPLITYVPSLNKYVPIPDVPQNTETIHISGTKLRELLRSPSLTIPPWFTPTPAVLEELRNTFNKTRRGLCIYLVGLSGSGKTTISHALRDRLLEDSSTPPITLLDGDEIRTNLSKGLGFSKADRSANVRRIGYVAHKITLSGGIAICANIAPYQEDREHNASLFETTGSRYLQVFVDTPLSQCEVRDPKGLYHQVREGTIKNFTGISDPFEDPAIDSNIVLDGTAPLSVNVNRILEHIKLM